MGSVKTVHHYCFSIEPFFPSFYKTMYKFSPNESWRDMRHVEKWLDSKFIHGTFEAEEDDLDIEQKHSGMCLYLLHQRSNSYVDIPFALKLSLSIFAEYEICLRYGGRAWLALISESRIENGWSDFVTEHELQNGYTILAQHTRQNIIDCKIFDNEKREVQYSWTAQINQRNLYEAVNILQRKEIVHMKFPMLKIYGVSEQREAMQFYQLHVYWNDYSISNWNKVPTEGNIENRSQDV